MRAIERRDWFNSQRLRVSLRSRMLAAAGDLRRLF